MIILDNGHGSRQYMKGAKQSPDGSLYEGEWAREITKMLKEALDKEGIPSTILVPENEDISLVTRVKRADAIYAKDKSSFLVSIHNNAKGADGKWHTAKGWSVFVSKKASLKSKKLANLLLDQAKKRNLLGNRDVPREGYWTWSWTDKDIYILTQSKCPAVLTENLFQDNKEDVKFLLNKEGKEQIVQLHVDAIKEFIK